MISQRNLSLLSNRLARGGGRRIPESTLERDYCIAWFLVALSRTSLSERLAFKGGTALKRFYFDDYRFSDDMDFTLVDENTPIETISEELQSVFAEAHRASAILFNIVRTEAQSNTHTVYIGYEGPLPGTQRKRIKTDVTIREVLVFEVENRPVLRGYAEYSDLPENALVPVYSLEEIAAEKVVALLDPARNEPRDLYDIWYIVERSLLDLRDLVSAVECKLRFRGRELADVQGSFLAKESPYRGRWESCLSYQMAQLPEFDGVYRAVKRALRQAELL